MKLAGAPTVSVVIAAYERSAALAVALASAREQSVREIEILVVGDATNDDSEAVVRCCGDPRLRFDNLPRHTGHQAGPNRHALSLARAPWIAYLGQDDLWLPSHLESMLAAVKRAAAELIVAGVYFAPSASGEAEARVWGLAPWGEMRDDEHVPPSGWLHTRRLAEAIGSWRSPEECELPPDVDFLRRARAVGARPISSGRISVIKLSAAQRPGSYRVKNGDEQQAWLERVRSTPDLAHELSVEALRALQRALPEPHIVDFGALALASAADWNRHWRAVRGVDRVEPTPPLDGERREGRAPRAHLHGELAAEIETGARFSVSVRIENPTRYRLASEAPNPVQLGYHWIPADGGAAVEGIRSPLVPALQPGDRAPYLVRVVAPGRAGSWRLRVALVQENVAWFDAESESFVATVEVTGAAPSEARKGSRDRA